MKNPSKKSKKENKAIFRILKSTFKKVIKQNCAVRLKSEWNSLCGIKFEYENEVLTIASTSGDRLLVNEIIVDDGEGFCEGIYNGDILEKITFIKDMLIGGSYVDYLEFEMFPDKLVIKDVANNITYCIPKFGNDKFPNFRQLFPTDEEDKKYSHIGVNVQYLEELKRMSVNPKHNILKLSLNKENPLAKILAETVNEDENVKSKMIIMPIELRR